MSSPSPRPRRAKWIVPMVLLVGAAGLGGMMRMRRSSPSPEASGRPAGDEARVPTARGGSPKPGPAAGGARGPRVWGVVIGIDRYQSGEIPACRGASRDARAFGRWLATTAGWETEGVLMMDDLGSPEHGEAGGPREDLLPTRENLDWAFREWLPRRLKPDDVVVVYFAGQAVGLPPREDAPKSAPPRSYLLPIDARPSNPDATGWRLDEAIDRVAASGANPVVCLLDTSLHGRGKRYAPASGFEPSATTLLEQVVRWPGVTAWLAGDGTPAAEAKAADEQSPFTSALLKGLGSRDRPSNLLACLDAMNRDPGLAAQGFRTLGGVAPDLNLWPAAVRRESASRRELLLQRGHAAGVSAIAFSADGSRMISGGQDSTIRVWRASDRMLLRVLSSHMVGVTALALGPDGRLLASGDGAGSLRTWDLARGVENPAPPPHARGVEAIAFLSDGSKFVSLDLDGKSWLWTPSEGGPKALPLSGRSQGLACSPQAGPFAFALAESDGKVLLHDADGAPKTTLDGPGGTVTTPRMATDGRRLAAGDDAGRAVAWEVESGRELLRRTFEGAVDAVALSPSGGLAVAAGGTIHLMTLGDRAQGEPRQIGIPAPANRVAFSPDGRWLAACTQGGSLHAWEIGPAGDPRPLDLEEVATSGAATTFAFSPDGRRLVSGDQDGGLRTWDLPHGVRRPPIAARRGQVAALSVSGDGRYLLQVSKDRQAQVWDLQEGRGLTSIPGAWTSGALTPDGEAVVLTSEVDGEPVVVDRADGVRRGTRFERPREVDGGGPTSEHFGRVAVSPDGRLVAAGSVQGPLVGVWELASGKLLHTIRGHDDPHPITGVQFAPDAPLLLTSSEDGTAKLWDLGADPPREAGAFRMADEASGDPIPVTAAQVGPGKARKVLAGGIDGRIRLWEVGKPQPIDMGSLGLQILAVAITPDGRWLAAAGADKAVWLWEAERPGRRIRLDPAPQHLEQVNALVAWPNNALIASGSDDTTVRLWGLADRSLLGTLSAEGGSADWVAYTPDGLFDSSVGGEAQVTWLDSRGVMPLEQFYEESHVFRLTDSLRNGVRPKAPAPPRVAPPRLSIDAPARPVEVGRVANLTISLAEPGLANLRLYQNGVPVRDDADFALAPGQTRLSAEVRLRPGLNRFHVMAGRPGLAGVEGRSQVVEIRCDAPEAPGRLHVLAMGVSRYEEKERALQFADRDAEELSGFLQRNGVRGDGGPGLRIVLTNDDVNEAKVDESFRALRDRVREHPEDTVVVFLAGHADTFRDRFYLLLSKFPFSKVNRPGGRPDRADAVADVDAKTVLPYAAIYRNIARLGALQRLVVVDACQAEAIADDPGVRRIQELLDGGSQRARTAYLMAARRGEPAGESAAISHGLMTYALLKGMGAPDLEESPTLAAINDVPNADRDGDGVVTTEELRWYTQRTVPRLAASFPLLVQRAGADGAMTSFRPDANLGQQPRIQAASATFPLVQLAESPARVKEGQ